MNTMYRLLIADDALDELECIVFLISKFKLPFEVTSAINGEDALGYLQQEHFDILLTDIQMPFMDGLELSKHALALYPDLRVVIISAHENFSKSALFHKGTASSKKIRFHDRKLCQKSSFTSANSR